MIAGHASTSGTALYRDRFPALREVQHFREPASQNLWLSSIGLGTYLGEPDDAADREYTDAIVTALRSGINVLDTAINYRHQRSERNIGTALANLIAAGELRRDQVFVSTKAGYLSFDGNLPADPRSYFIREYVEPGILDPSQIAGGMHCMAPSFLENQIERSRRNLGLETIDLFYLHNPETQLGEIARDAFYARLRQAFDLLEAQVGAGHLRYYGMATWNGLRVPDTSRDFIDLFRVEEMARQAGGDEHHFRFLQAPFNLAMPEAYTVSNQQGQGERMSLLAAAGRLSMGVFGSATLLQGRLAAGLPRQILQRIGARNDAQAAIQFARSAPGLATALVGMGHREHVPQNLDAVQSAPASFEQWSALVSAA